MKQIYEFDRAEQAKFLIEYYTEYLEIQAIVPPHTRTVIRCKLAQWKAFLKFNLELCPVFVPIIPIASFRHCHRQW
ncbi:MAG: hypothetical protein HC781_22720 [Leptolyngbyaceae cyanobacterium CSU_1_4]|nr:hypothetical protein [Leptolyngbyaceae cyanobacterium CSU_1_4]